MAQPPDQSRSPDISLNYGGEGAYATASGWWDAGPCLIQSQELQVIYARKSGALPTLSPPPTPEPAHPALTARANRRNDLGEGTEGGAGGLSLHFRPWTFHSLCPNRNLEGTPQAQRSLPQAPQGREEAGGVRGQRSEGMGQVRVAPAR